MESRTLRRCLSLNPSRAVSARVRAALWNSWFASIRRSASHLLGVKGLAGLVFVGVPAAIANAVFNALGSSVTELPITLEKLL